MNRQVQVFLAAGLAALLLAGHADARGGRRKARRKLLAAPPPAAKSSDAGERTGLWAGGVSSMPVRQWYPGSAGISLAAGEGRALVLGGFGNLDVVGTSGTPALLGSVAVPGSPAGLFADGDDAVAVTDVTGLADSSADAQDGVWKQVSQVTNLLSADPSDPRVLGTLRLDGRPIRAALHGSMLEVVTLEEDYGYAWLTPGDVESMAPDGAEPSFYPWYPTSTTRVFTVSLADPANPAVAGSASVEGRATEAFLEEGRVVVVLGESGWYGDPLAGQNGGPGVPKAARGNDAPGASGGVLVFAVDGAGNVGDPLEGSWTGLSVSASDLRGDVLRLLGYGYETGGMEVVLVDLAAEGGPAVTGSLDLAAYPQATVFAGDRLFTLEGGYQVWTGGGDGTEPPLGSPGSNGFLPKAPSGLLTSDGEVPSLLTAYDLSDPSDPAPAGTLELPVGVAGLAVDGNRAVVLLNPADYGEGPATQLRSIDVSELSAMAEDDVADLDLRASVRGFTDGLLLLDAYDWEVGGGLLAVAVGDDGSLAPGAFVRTGPYGPVATAGTTSEFLAAGGATVSVVDFTDPADPILRGTVEIAADVADLAPAGSDLAALVRDGEGGTASLRILSRDDPDARRPLARLDLGAADDAHLFPNGSTVTAVLTTWWPSTTRFVVVDLSEPEAPALRGSLEHEGIPAGPMIPGEGALFFLEYPAYEAFDGNGAPEAQRFRDEEKDPAFADGSTGDAPFWQPPEMTLRAVDLSDPDAPRLAGSAEVGYDFAAAPVLENGTIYLSGYDWWSTRGGEDWCLYTLRTVDVSDLDDLVAGDEVQIPGSLLFVNGDGSFVTMKYGYDAKGRERDDLCRVVVADGKATVTARARVAGSVTAAVRGADHAYLSTMDYSWEEEDWADGKAASLDGPRLQTLDLASFTVVDDIPSADAAYRAWIAGGRLFLRSWSYQGGLEVFDLADPSAPAPAGTFAATGYGEAVVVDGDRAFLAAGYGGVVVLNLQAE